MRTEHVTNTATPIGQLGIISLVKEDVFFLFFFGGGGVSSKLVSQRMQTRIGQCECEVRRRYLALHIHIEVPSPYAI